MHHVDLGTIAPHHRHQVGLDVEFYDAPGHTPGAPWDEICRPWATSIAQDKITYVGSSNFAAWNIVQGCEQAARRGWWGWFPNRASTI
jgi:aryl-alcohol dehydrogenase-like predicted oxidoreductase